MHIVEFRDEIYLTNHVVCMGTYEEANILVKETFFHDGMELSHEGHGYACTFLMEEGLTVRFLWLDEVLSTLKSMILLAHEVNHIAFQVLKERGIEDEEAHCYYCDYLSHNILNQLQEKEKCLKTCSPKKKTTKSKKSTPKQSSKKHTKDS